jgi:hypothetical protein
LILYAQTTDYFIASHLFPCRRILCFFVPQISPTPSFREADLRLRLRLRSPCLENNLSFAKLVSVIGVLHTRQNRPVLVIPPLS